MRGVLLFLDPGLAGSEPSPRSPRLTQPLNIPHSVYGEKPTLDEISAGL